MELQNKNTQKDIRTKELIEKGFKVLRLWEFEINKMSLNDFKVQLNFNQEVK
jgi:very-short-patch-repair endonuclease